MWRGLLLAGGIVVVLALAVAALNRAVDPKDEFYSGAPLTEALSSHCLLADDVVGPRSYPEFKQDLFGRHEPKRVVLGSNFRARGAERSYVQMGFPGFGPEPLLDAMRFLERAAPNGKRLTVYVVTELAWFDGDVEVGGGDDDSFASRAGYLLSPRTLKASLDLVRRSRKLAFTGWRNERVGRRCVVDRGSPRPAWRADGTLLGAPQDDAGDDAAGGRFAWSRLTPLDLALAIAQTERWRVVALSQPRVASPLWQTYERELAALFAKHGYKWRVRRMPL